MTQSYIDAGEILHVPDGQCTGRFKSGIGRERNRKKKKKKKRILKIMACCKIA